MTTLFPPSESLWRCVRSKPKCEHLAAEQLGRAGFEAYCPRLRHQRKTARGLVWFVEALFPGYVFAQFPMDQNRLVRATNYVLGLLDFTPDCGAVSEEAVQDLRRSFPGGEILTVHITPMPGDQVELVSGAFRGHEAVVTQLMPATQRVRILMDFLGSPRQLEVSIQDLLGFHNPRVEAYAAQV